MIEFEVNFAVYDIIFAIENSIFEERKKASLNFSKYGMYQKSKHMTVLSPHSEYKFFSLSHTITVSL